jgi:hypothetical protein
MDDRKYLTAEEVSERHRGAVSVGTLRNWRALRVGPAFVKIGKAVLYPIGELDAWDKRNMVSCRAPGRQRVAPESYRGAHLHVLQVSCSGARRPAPTPNILQ